MRELVNDAEHAELPAIVGAILDEVVGPHMVAVLRPQADARSIRQPQASSLRLLGWNLQPLTPPIRSTRLSFTSQPALRSRAVILR